MKSGIGVVAALVLVLVSQQGLACDGKKKADPVDTAMSSKVETKAEATFGYQQTAVHNAAGEVRVSAESSDMEAPYDLGDMDVFEFSFSTHPN